MLQSFSQSECDGASNVFFSGKSNTLVILLRIVIASKNLSPCMSLWAAGSQVWEGLHEAALLRGFFTWHRKAAEMHVKLCLTVQTRCFQNSSRTFFLLNSSNKGTEAKHINISEHYVAKLKMSFFSKSIV